MPKNSLFHLGLKGLKRGLCIHICLCCQWVGSWEMRHEGDIFLCTRLCQPFSRVRKWVQPGPEEFPWTPDYASERERMWAHLDSRILAVSMGQACIDDTLHLHWFLCVVVAQWCPTLCDPMNCSLSGFSIHGIFQARILKWVAVSFSRGSSQPRDWTLVSCIVGKLYYLSHQGNPLLAYWFLGALIQFRALGSVPALPPSLGVGSKNKEVYKLSLMVPRSQGAWGSLCLYLDSAYEQW